MKIVETFLNKKSYPNLKELKTMSLTEPNEYNCPIDTTETGFKWLTKVICLSEREKR